ncbi:MAG: hypothetical protein PHT51_00725 [Patescibacteria group bacterium]|nr:hypothetical protein [Patescibacteria group bacterium]MDD4611228.1 hypothetical protein [Patescibacteria group bacterium]
MVRPSFFRSIGGKEFFNKTCLQGIVFPYRLFKFLITTQSQGKPWGNKKNEKGDAMYTTTQTPLTTTMTAYGHLDAMTGHTATDMGGKHLGAAHTKMGIKA